MKKSIEEFQKMFGNDVESMGKMMEGYLYLKVPDLYIYKIREMAARFSPPSDLVLKYPTEIGTPELEDLSEIAVQKTLASLMNPETSTYHAKVVKLEDASKIVNINRDISLTNLENVIPYKHARDIILKNPDHLSVMECTCRRTKENACEPLDVCMIVGEPFSSFVLEHGTNNARKIDQEEAVEILKAEDQRGHVHTAWFKDAMGDRFYAICNCCSCCCGGMHAHKLGIPMLAHSGYVSEVSEECTGCGECAGYCQFGAISIEDDKAVIDYQKCMGCGVCESKCAVEAISLKRDPAKGQPLDIVALAS